MKKHAAWQFLPVLVLLLAGCTFAPTSAPAATRTPYLTRTPIPTPTWVLPSPVQVEAGNVAITVLPQESNDLLINPGKGWVLYYPYSDRPDEIWEVVGVCYSRLDWSWIEPTEGDFQWPFIDDAIAACAEHGKPFAFGIMAANTSSASESVTPSWVFEAGAQGIPYMGSADNVLRAPVWNDPVYLEKMQHLINALAARYDGDPAIAYIDARNCGNWGEWHSFGCSELGDQDRAVLVDQWSVFKQTQIIVNTNGNAAEYQARYGTDTYGFGIRSDGADVRNLAVTYAYDKAPTVAEWAGSYEDLKLCRGVFGDCFTQEMIPDTMNSAHYSYYNLGGWGQDAELFYNENVELVHEWGNRMGYWLKLTQVTYPADLGNGSLESLSFKVRNDGVTPVYVNHNTTYVRLALLDQSGIALAVSEPLAGINPFNWKPGQEYSETISFSFPATPGAQYLAIGLFSDPASLAPDISFGNQGRLPNLWFPIQGSNQP